ncbi:DUF2325 domain-containing protein [Azospirillum sp.]|uniref:DUF2325 domain-containing protein n=1 Tax=Azospirillum sp. TaxID=34012 RepID=UPI002D359391|nr:DUF2325 domain-containing protein [Azospirillum sp.]HYD65010.1 DUF2325 domain-containing protein [Azospirillum sp.]
MCEQCRKSEPARLISHAKRRKIWQIDRKHHCSIVGTCLSHEDLEWACRRLGIERPPGLRDYDLHRYFVEQVGNSGAPARLLHKRLDEKYAGEVRRFARATDEEGWLALWEQAVASGSVAAAYWAVLSHAGVPESVAMRAYGDVHMLSHLLGAQNRRTLRQQHTLEARCAELEDRLARAERSTAERIAEKDARIRALEAELAQARAAQAAPARPAARPSPSAGRLERGLARANRRVAAERARARAAEGELARLRILFDAVPTVGQRAAVPEPTTPAAPALPAAPPDLGGQAILYVGGRPNLVPRLRETVQTLNGDLLHHDGGVEQATHCLEGLVERADLVVCPIDCVSHDACLRVKGLCRRMRKPFIPLRSSGATTFLRTLETLAPARPV